MFTHSKMYCEYGEYYRKFYSSVNKDNYEGSKKQAAWTRPHREICRRGLLTIQPWVDVSQIKPVRKGDQKAKIKNRKSPFI